VAGLAGYLSAWSPDVLVASSNPANLAALRARDRSGRPIPVVITVNVDPQAALEGRNRLHGGLLRLMMRRHYPRADAMVANTRGIAESVASVAGVPRELIITIPNPVDCAAIREQARAPIAHPWLAPGAPPLILAAGKLKPQKDFATLLRAFARLREVREANLTILGEGELRPELTRLVRSLGLSGSVEMPGFCGNPHAWMARAAVFVLSSRWEGFSNVLAEALAVGCPVVSTDCPSGPSELLAGGEFGALVAPGDPSALAAAIAATIAAPPDRTRLMARADTFSIGVAAERYLAAMRVAGGRRAARHPAGSRTAA
jgi:glycosyltransferase involved in cell wall biosynthesis